MKKTFSVWLIILFFLFGCSKPSEVISGDAIVSVNGYEIYRSEIDKARQINDSKGFSEQELLEGIIMETLVLQRAAQLRIAVKSEEIESKITQLKELGDTFYTKAIAIYGSEDLLRESYRNKILYDGAKEVIISDFLSSLSIKSNIVHQRMIDYVRQIDLHQITESEKSQYAASVEREYLLITKNELLEQFFAAWQYDSAQGANIITGNVPISLFTPRNYEIDGEKIRVDEETHNLETLELEDFRKIFGSFLYLSDELINKHGDVEIKFLHIPKKNIKVATIRLNSGELEITVIVDPRIAYGNSKINFVETSAERISIERIQENLGIYYIITGHEDEGLLSVLGEMTPFSINDYK
ncbi:MAG: SurA N-terminal domain-containing protein [Bacteroidaceae bacterium]|nr:SurA N-terminal domain-containing protein [Bacteroidaceae bacterium]